MRRLQCEGARGCEVCGLHVDLTLTPTTMAGPTFLTCDPCGQKVSRDVHAGLYANSGPANRPRP